MLDKAEKSIGARSNVRRAEKTTFDTPTVVSKVGISPFCK